MTDRELVALMASIIFAGTFPRYLPSSEDCVARAIDILNRVEFPKKKEKE